MAGSPSQEAAERQSRKRRGSQINPDKAKKSTASLSPSRADKITTKPARMAPADAKSLLNTEPSTTKGPSMTSDKASGSVVDGGTKPKVPKLDSMSKASKAKSKSANIAAKVPANDLAKEKKLDEKDKTTVKKEDGKDKKPDTKENKPDTKGKSTKGKSPHHLPSLRSDHYLPLGNQPLTYIFIFQVWGSPRLVRVSSCLTS